MIHDILFVLTASVLLATAILFVYAAVELRKILNGLRYFNEVALGSVVYDEKGEKVELSKSKPGGHVKMEPMWDEQSDPRES